MQWDFNLSSSHRLLHLNANTNTMLESPFFQLMFSGGPRAVLCTIITDSSSGQLVKLTQLTRLAVSV